MNSLYDNNNKKTTKKIKTLTLITLANRSKQFPTAMSIVSPKIRYRLSEYEITLGEG